MRANRRIVALQLFGCAVISAAVTFTAYLLHANATTAALGMLICVLGIATRWGWREAVFSSVLFTLAFNFYFLPPIGTLTIADPQNWVALGAFLITAIVASHLSATAKARAEEAALRTKEIERLYALSRSMLYENSPDLEIVSKIFDLRQAAYYDCETGTAEITGDGPITRESLANAAEKEQGSTAQGMIIRPVRLGTRIVGSMGLAGNAVALSAAELDSIATLLAVNTERRRALERAASAEAARRGESLKRYVLDGLAHDLKTPLASIKTCVTTLLSVPMSSPEKRSELLSIIEEAADRLDRTVSEAMELAQIEAQRLTLHRDQIQLSEFLEKLLAEHDSGPPFFTGIEPGLVLSADAQLLRRALRHVLENALKYSKQGTRVDVEAKKTTDCVAITIADRGPGISPSELDRIFEKFYRGVRGRDHTQGTGMGLAIAKGIIEAHGGRIRAANRAGGGAVITIQLPAV